MTRQEAINYLKSSGMSPEQVTAVVEALKAEPCDGAEVITVKDGTLKMGYGRYVIYDREFLKTHFNTTEAKIYGESCEDCISRQAMHNAIDAGYWTGNELAKIIDSLPSVKPTRPKGKWIIHGSGDGYKKWHCSECEMLVRDPQKPWYKHCPNCGAEMEVEDADSN